VDCNKLTYRIYKFDELLKDDDTTWID